MTQQEGKLQGGKAEAITLVGKLTGTGIRNAVLYTAQSLTEAQQEQARANIGAGTPYTLPQASQDALGGIKADAAETADTQPVRIGGDGKLYTAPGGDTSIGITGASAGQIPKVKAVDASGAPTAWEAEKDTTPFIVTVGTESSGYTSSHTFDEIAAAASAGRVVMAYSDYINFPQVGKSLYGAYFDLISTQDEALFRYTDGLLEYYVTVMPSGTSAGAGYLSATSSSFGGIKADSAEATDTQPVRIGGDGKLYTAPGGGADISLGISGATAGQMAKIKTVNESGAPTAWEAGDAASGNDWRLIKTITVGEDIGKIDAFTTDDAGNEFSLSAVKVVSNNAALGESSTATDGAIRVWLSKRNTTNAENMRDILPGNAYIEPAFSGNTSIGFFVELKKHGCVATIAQNKKGGELTIWERRCSEENNIERIAFSTGNGNTMLIGAGTILYVWGIDA